jgi:hypothetical protein
VEEQVLVKMRSFVLFWVMTLCFGAAFADQYQTISKENAEAVQELLLEVDTLVEWCHCCDTSFATAKKYVVHTVELVQEGYSNWYELEVKVKLSDGSIKTLKNVDMAYIHIRDGEMSLSLADYLDLKSYQCAGPFEWDLLKVE